ncbi:hypothetical protein [Noviherbaspirillum pedocola]|uniref:Uncharacterized protein n=1 Tax=Noviherbaspirillum pedocola TaxID=2801341 RepID=A0A934SV93_9BURK|nr:hypothetical protein [Noviherbaspirillum pedocola]MBK4735963.1 hypothetical protein [Noviherbaspirillum pedocola]
MNRTPNTALVEASISRMLDLIAHYGLKLLETYPNDLLVIDREILQRAAHPGASIAWMVGDSHTHTYPLGIHRELNRGVTYVTNLCNTDRFFRIDFGATKDSLRFTELDRGAFAALANAPVPYRIEGERLDFDLFNGSRLVGSCKIICTDYFAHRYSVAITPASGITATDYCALYEWTGAAVCDHGTQFAKWELSWHDAAADALAA